MAGERSVGNDGKHMVVLVVGGGGREHALAWKLAQSDMVEQVLVAPGNGGTHLDGKLRNIAVDAGDAAAVVALCRERRVALVCVGPEVPLVNGLADALRAAGIACFGPSALAARLEGSKVFSKAFMVRHGIPTAAHASFSDFAQAEAYVRGLPRGSKVVVKASGLAAGKGVVLPESTAAVVAALEQIMVAKEFGAEAGAEVVVEELLEGPEVSLFAFCDGADFLLLPAAQDHKRIFDGDAGPNTGGMGAYCPAAVLTPALRAQVEADVVRKTIEACRQEGFPFVGLLYCGLMLTPRGPRLLEYNCRFGDPETQAVLMLLDSDLFQVMRACATGALKAHGPLVIAPIKAAATVVLAAGGYPGAYAKGARIAGCSTAEMVPGVKVFHAGTARDKAGALTTAGGRVLAVSAVGASLPEALERAYVGVKQISFDGMQFRKDIGRKGLPGYKEPERGLRADEARLRARAALAALAGGLVALALLRR
jgi:phosphoribosylamine--glycine ligase/phosphoribosylformylglycinamidine cyclo-ligase